MTDQLAELRARIAERRDRVSLSAFRLHSGATYTTRTVQDLRATAAANARKKAANGAQYRVEGLRGDDTIPVESRRRQIAEALAKGQADTRKQLDRMEDALTVLESGTVDRRPPAVGQSQGCAGP